MSSVEPTRSCGVRESLMQACRSGQLNVVERLLDDASHEAGASTMQQIAYQTACASGQLHIVQKLISTASIGSSNVQAWQDLGFLRACDHGHTHVAQELLRQNHVRGVDVIRFLREQIHPSEWMTDTTGFVFGLLLSPMQLELPAELRGASSAALQRSVMYHLHDVQYFNTEASIANPTALGTPLRPNHAQQRHAALRQLCSQLIPASDDPHGVKRALLYACLRWLLCCLVQPGVQSLFPCLCDPRFQDCAAQRSMLLCRRQLLWSGTRARECFHLASGDTAVQWGRYGRRIAVLHRAAKRRGGVVSPLIKSKGVIQGHLQEAATDST